MNGKDTWRSNRPADRRQFIIGLSRSNNAHEAHKSWLTGTFGLPLRIQLDQRTRESTRLGKELKQRAAALSPASNNRDADHQIEMEPLVEGAKEKFITLIHPRVSTCAIIPPVRGETNHQSKSKKQAKNRQEERKKTADDPGH